LQVIGLHLGEQLAAYSYADAGIRAHGIEPMSDPTRASKELMNRVVLVACSAKKMAELVAGLEAMGGDVLPFPVIEAQDIEDKHLLDKALSSLQGYDWIVFTSAYGVSYFMQRMRERGIRAGLEGMPKICAIGPATAEALGGFGHRADLVPEQYIAEGVVKALGTYYGGIQRLAGRSILLPRAQEARELIPEALAAAGARVDVVPCYRTVRGEIDPNAVQRLRERSPDLLVFTSSSTIRNLINILGPERGRSVLQESTVAVLGPVVGNTAQSFGKRPEIVPSENTVPALLKAIREYYSSFQQTAANRQ
jgi:uroporphyrinogen III methyltransferase/synthase